MKVYNVKMTNKVNQPIDFTQATQHKTVRVDGSVQGQSPVGSCPVFLFGFNEVK